MSGSVRMFPVNKDANDEGPEKVQRRGSAVLNLRSDGAIANASPKCTTPQYSKSSYDAIALIYISLY